MPTVPRHPLTVVWVGGLCVLLAVGIPAMLVWGCQYQTGDFQCGAAFQGDPTVAQACDQPHQACVCRTNGCAVEVDPTVCDGGLQYVAPPFADPGAGGDAGCVAIADVAWIISPGATNAFCSAEGPDGGAGGASGTGGGDAGTGGASSTTTKTSSGGTGGAP
jgi:hypothetical protein